MTRTSLILALAVGLSGCARTDTPPEIAVEDVWARATVQGQSAAAAYATIVNRGRGADRLVAVGSAESTAALHGSQMRDGVARMRPLEGLPIPPRGSVRLEPGKTHVMLTGLRRPLVAGGSFELTLVFERSGRKQVSGKVVGASAPGPHGGH